MILTLQQKLIGLAVWTVLIFSTGFYTAGKFDLAAQAKADNQQLADANKAVQIANDKASKLEEKLAKYQARYQKFIGDKINEKVNPFNNCPLSSTQLHSVSLFTTAYSASK